MVNLDNAQKKLNKHHSFHWNRFYQTSNTSSTNPLLKAICLLCLRMQNVPQIRFNLKTLLESEYPKEKVAKIVLGASAFSLKSH